MWFANAFFSGMFALIGISHGAKLDRATFKGAESGISRPFFEDVIQTSVGGITISILLIVSYVVVTSLILLKKTIKLNGAGATYGFAVGLSIMMFFQMLQTAYTLQIILDFVKSANANWSAASTRTHKALFVFAYMSSCSYLVVFIVMLFSAKLLQDDVSEPEPMRLQESASNA